jgi:hypothetical protein
MGIANDVPYIRILSGGIEFDPEMVMEGFLGMV